MKTVILAGGLGTRISEETLLKPKPMIEIGGKPILWHIMKIYSHYGINDFIICLGYKGYLIKEYFFNYFNHQSDITVDLENNKIIYHKKYSESWKITLVDTGLNTMTGSRLKMVQKHLKNDKYFCFTYGDGLADVNIDKLIKLHKKEKKIATVTAIKPKNRFGIIENEGNHVIKFVEKPLNDYGWINGGFFVLSNQIFDYIGDSQDLVWERDIMTKLVENQQMSVYFHDGFWQSMDTLREKNLLNKMWEEGEAPWKIWGKQNISGKIKEYL